MPQCQTSQGPAAWPRSRCGGRWCRWRQSRSWWGSQPPEGPPATVWKQFENLQSVMFNESCFSALLPDRLADIFVQPAIDNSTLAAKSYIANMDGLPHGLLQKIRKLVHEVSGNKSKRHLPDWHSQHSHLLLDHWSTGGSHKRSRTQCGQDHMKTPGCQSTQNKKLFFLFF